MDWLTDPLSGNALLWFGVFACHFLGDFAFQGDWMATGKNKSLEINGYHALTHTGTFIFLWLIPGIQITVAAVFLLLISHFVIDLFKGYLAYFEQIWIDQLLHSGVYVILLCSELIIMS